jgi:hypothetical protein
MRRMTFIFGLSLTSTALAQPAAPTEAPATGPKDDQIVCKREAEVGSLVRGKTTCMTRAEWARAADGARNAAARLQGEGLGGSHCVPSLNPNDPQC